jgi:sarcosine oxidase
MSARERADVVIVGAGLLGLSTAYALHGRRDVVVLEREAVGHARAGSHGPSRVFRLGYPDRRYVEMAISALARWRALEEETGTALLQITGQLSFGPGAHDVFEALLSAGCGVERLDSASVAQRFPMFAGHGGAVFEPDSGVLAASAVLTGLQEAAGCDVREHTPVRRISDRERGVRIECDGYVVDANVAVVTAGPWTSSLVDAAPTTFATLEHVAYVRPRSSAAARPPVFIDHGRPIIYGLPTPGSDLYKVALHHAGAVVDPDTADRKPDARAVETLEAAARAWLTDFDHVAEAVDTCIYDNTPDEHFIIQRSGNVVVGYGTSGHGFKFGVLLGEMLAGLVEKEPPRR